MRGVLILWATIAHALVTIALYLQLGAANEALDKRDARIADLQTQVEGTPTCREMTVQSCLSFWFNSEPTTIGREFKRLCGKKK